MDTHDKNTIGREHATAPSRGAFLRGVVVSNKMKDTIVVKVVRFVKDARYKKYRKRAKRFHVHDAGNTKAIGDTVTLQSCRPISKNKHYKVV